MNTFLMMAEMSSAIEKLSLQDDLVLLDPQPLSVQPPSLQEES